MDTVKAIRNRILQLCQQHDMSINKLANLSAIPPSSLKNILYGKRKNPKIITIKMLCDGIGITLREFFSSEEFDWYLPYKYPSVSSLEKICEAFGITMSQFFADSLSAVDLTPDQRDVLDNWSALREKQKEIILVLIKNMPTQN